MVEKSDYDRFSGDGVPNPIGKSECKLELTGDIDPNVGSIVYADIDALLEYLRGELSVFVEEAGEGTFMAFKIAAVRMTDQEHDGLEPFENPFE